MDIQTIKALFDAFYQAKRCGYLALPKGVTASYIHYLDTVESLERQVLWVKVSDISDALNIPRPGVTRTVKEMEAKGYLCKHTSSSDGRITYVSITEAGKRLSQAYNEQYFNRSAPCCRTFPSRRRSVPSRPLNAFIKSCPRGRSPLRNRSLILPRAAS